MGKRGRARARAHDLRKQPNEKKKPFVERKVRELVEMDKELERVIQGS